MILSPQQQHYIQQQLQYVKVRAVCIDYGIDSGKFYRWMRGVNSDTEDTFVEFAKRVFNVDILNFQKTSKKRNAEVKNGTK